MNDQLRELVESDTSGTSMSTQGCPSQWVRWTNWLVWFCVILLVIVVGRNLWLSKQHYEQVGAIRCDEPVFDFGTVFEQELVKHSFQLINISKTPLTIAKVITSCHCTTAKSELIGSTIAPGKLIKVPVTLTLKNTKPSKSFESKVFIEFVETPHVRVTLSLKGVVK